MFLCEVRDPAPAKLKEGPDQRWLLTLQQFIGNKMMHAKMTQIKLYSFALLSQPATASRSLPSTV